jgi:predicted aspartyl protease
VKAAVPILACAVIAVGLAPASAQDVPSPEELVARARTASGLDHRPEAERETWFVRIAGLDGTSETTRRGPDVTTTTSLGPFRTERGTYRGMRWRQNENGETIIERPEPSQTERAVSRTVTRVRDPIEAWQLTTTFASGHIERRFYDARTYELIRVERTVAGRTTRTVYDDFRTDGRGRTRPWHYSGGDGRPDSTFDYRLVRDEEAPDVSDAELAIPHDRRNLVDFPPGIDAVRLPARFEQGRIVVRLEVGGRGLDFLLDTGAAALSIDTGVARELGLAAEGRSAQTVGGTFATSRVVVPVVGIGPLSMRDVVMQTIPVAQQASRSTRVVGLLGFDFLDAVGLKIDYADGEVDAFRPGTLEPPATATALDVRLNSGTPVVRATVGGASGDDFIVDTGASFSYVLFQRFARAHQEVLASAGDGKVRYGSAVGGTLPYRSIAAKRLALGPWTFADALGVEALSPAALGFDNEDGLIGADILRLFTVYLDYAGSRLFLSPNERMQSIEVTTSGR